MHIPQALSLDQNNVTLCLKSIWPKSKLAQVEFARPMYTRKIRVLPCCSASVKSKFKICVVALDNLSSYFHSPGLCRGAVNSSCLRKSPPATCPSCSREAMIVSERERNTSLVVLGREKGFSTSVPAFEQGLVLSALVEGTISPSMSRGEDIVVCPVTSATELSHVCGGSRSRSSLVFLSNLWYSCFAASIKFGSVRQVISQYEGDRIVH